MQARAGEGESMTNDSENVGYPGYPYAGSIVGEDLAAQRVRELESVVEHGERLLDSLQIDLAQQAEIYNSVVEELDRVKASLRSSQKTEIEYVALIDRQDREYAQLQVDYRCFVELTLGLVESL